MIDKVKLLQSYLIKYNYDAFFVPREDEFLNEYIIPSSERLRWVSNFTGSSGIAIILRKKAVIFSDGRYTIQINKEVNKKNFKILNISKFYEWIDNNFKSDFRVAIDPWLFSVSKFKEVEKNIKNKKVKIFILKKNPIDLLWKNKPAKPLSQVFVHKIKFSGISAERKIKTVQLILKKNNCNYFILNSLDSIAWLLNLRGSDIKHTPLNLAYAMVPLKGKIDLYINKKKFSKSNRYNLSSVINLIDISQLENFFSKIKNKSSIGLDGNNTPYWFAHKLSIEGFLIKYFEDPCVILKSKKNAVEIKGAKNANIRDGASITKYLYWLKHSKIKNNNESLASNKLFTLRKRNKYFFSLSFETISAFGSNAAIPHYRVTKSSNKKFKKNGIYLVDSGAQYLDGTTDITRTIILGKPSIEQKDRFTRVLKGHISLAKCEFNNNTRGSEIDYLARKHLKEINCDYAHGTGHGIGSFLSVHEGPQRISKKTNKKDPYLQPGMIISNEPGYYKYTEYGIRIENLILVKRFKKNKLKFETISWAPVDKDLILYDLLSKSEIEWINNYHKNVYEKIKMYLSAKEKNWLKKVTEPLM